MAAGERVVVEPHRADPRPHELHAEIALLADQDAKKGLTIVPIEVYTKGRNVKARIAIVRGKNKTDKREDLKRRDAKREAERVMKSR